MKITFIVIQTTNVTLIINKKRIKSNKRVQMVANWSLIMTLYSDRPLIKTKQIKKLWDSNLIRLKALQIKVFHWKDFRNFNWTKS